MHFDLKAVTFEDRDQLGCPAVTSEFVILACGALGAGPADSSDVSQNFKFAALAVELQIIDDLDPVTVHDALERHQRRVNTLCRPGGDGPGGQSGDNPAGQSRGD